MSTVAAFIFISLDGFYEGPNGEIDWPITDRDFRDFAVRQLDAAGPLGFGRATYEHMAAWWPTEQGMASDPAISARMNEKEKLVFSTTLTEASWPGSTVVRGEATERVRALKAAAGGELLVMGSPHLTASLAQAGVLDELRVMVCPVLLGQGRSLFEDLKDRVALTLLDVRRFDSGNLILTYRPARLSRRRPLGGSAVGTMPAGRWRVNGEQAVHRIGGREHVLTGNLEAAETFSRPLAKSFRHLGPVAANWRVGRGR